MSATRRLAAVAALFALSACRPALPAGTPPADRAEVVAEGGGVAITRAELDQRSAGRLARIEQEQYEVRRTTLDEMIDEQLLDGEAKSRGISREDLLRDEVERQVPPPDPAEVRMIYEQNRGQLGGRRFEEVAARIEGRLRERAVAARRAHFLARLREKAQVTVRLAPPRAEVTVPTGAPTMGPQKAPITIVGFADYQCPFCHRAQTTIDEVMSRYAGQVQLVHRDFPLEGHPGAIPAARAARCAGEQGRFWDYHRSLMTVKGDLSDADLQSRAAAFQLDVAAFGACLASDRHDLAIQQSVEEGTRMGVTGTPTFFINGRMLSGARPFEDFRQIIEGELGRAS